VASKTRLIYTKELTLKLVESIGHGALRPNDVAVGPDGSTVQATPMAALTLQNAKRVKTVGVHKDADGNMHIVLEE
jgi:hypothetical protein